MDNQPAAPLAFRYEALPRERRFQGSINASETVWWSGELVIPEDSGLALITLERHGAASTVMTADDEVSMMVALEDLPTVQMLLGHLIADATG